MNAATSLICDIYLRKREKRICSFIQDIYDSQTHYRHLWDETWLSTDALIHLLPRNNFFIFCSDRWQCINREGNLVTNGNHWVPPVFLSRTLSLSVLYTQVAPQVSTGISSGCHVQTSATARQKFAATFFIEEQEDFVLSPGGRSLCAQLHLLCVSLLL